MPSSGSSIFYIVNGQFLPTPLHSLVLENFAVPSDPKERHSDATGRCSSLLYNSPQHQLHKSSAVVKFGTEAHLPHTTRADLLGRIGYQSPGLGRLCCVSSKEIPQSHPSRVTSETLKNTPQPCLPCRCKHIQVYSRQLSICSVVVSTCAS